MQYMDTIDPPSTEPLSKPVSKNSRRNIKSSVEHHNHDSLQPPMDYKKPHFVALKSPVYSSHQKSHNENLKLPDIESRNVRSMQQFEPNQKNPVSIHRTQPLNERDFQ